MIPALHLVVGVVAAAAGWLIIRVSGGAQHRFDRWLLLDVLLPAGAFGLLLLATGRPLLAGLLTLALGAGYAYAERAKRKSLLEPIVFTDVFQALDIFRHPQLAVPFQNLASILFSALAALAALLLLFLWEPSISLGRPGSLFLLILGLVSGGWFLGGPGNRKLAESLRRVGMGDDVYGDAARFGTLASLLGYGIIARSERARLQGANGPEESSASLRTDTAVWRAPVLLIQCESFFDARRLGEGVIVDLLPGFDSIRQDSLQWGRLGVPCWGANTVRTEFAVLTGLDEAAIGMDRFNPYYRLARKPMASLAWQLRARGYHTVCIHPFDRRFYSRDRVMPQLGFDRIIGEEAFIDSPRINGFVADRAIVAVVESLIAEHHGNVFVFVITIENHGPWTDPASAAGSLLAPGLKLAQPETAALERYLTSLRHGDDLLAALAANGEDGRLIAFYGDHQPSLHLSTHADGDNSSDYVIWQAGKSGDGIRRDLPAHRLSSAVMNALDS